MSVVLQCKPPVGSPRPNITWYKNGKALLLRGRRVRLRSRNGLIIKRVQMRDSGEYQCVAKNMAARREGPVMTLDVRGLSLESFISTDVFEPRIATGS